MADVKVRMLLEDQVSAKLKQIDSSLEGFKNGLASGFKQLSSMVTPMQMLSLAAGAVGVAMTAAKKAFDLGREGAQLERLQEAGESLAKSMGSNMDEIVRKVKEASLDTVSSVNIIASANKSMMLGVTADADKLAKLMEIAALRGRAMGVSTTQAFDDMVRGIGRLSPLILDNLGIVIDADRTYKEYAESLDKTSAKLTAAEKRQALLNRVLQEGQTQLDAVGGLQEDAATGFEQLDAAVKDLSDAFKMDLAPAASVAAKALGDYADYINLQREAQEAANKALELGLIKENQHRDIIANLNRGVLDASVVYGEMTAKIEAFQDSLEGVNPDMAELIRLSEKSTSQVLDLAGALPKASAEVENVEKAMMRLGGAQKGVATGMENIKKSHEDLNDALAENVYDAAGEAVRKYADDLLYAAEMQTWLAIATGETTPEQEALNLMVERATELLAAGVLSLDDWKDAIDKMADGTLNAAGMVQLLNGYIKSLPSSKQIDIYVNWYGTQYGEVPGTQQWGGEERANQILEPPGSKAIGGFGIGGMEWVGETGPELVWMPGNAQVTSNTQLTSMAMNGGGGPTIGSVNVYAAQGQSVTQIANAVIAQINRSMQLSRSAGLAYVG